MSIVLASLASLLVLSVVPGSSAQQSGPLDEDIEDYIITGVDPACPFSNSAAVCTEQFCQLAPLLASLVLRFFASQDFQFNN